MIKRKHSEILDGEDAPISDLERVRMENIKKNEQFLANIGLEDVRPDPLTKHAASRRGMSAPPSHKQHEQPTRRSTRVTIDKIKSDIEVAKSSGNMESADILEKKELLATLLEKKNASDFSSYLNTEPMSDPISRLETDPIFLNSIYNQSDAEDSHWVDDIVKLLHDIDGERHSQLPVFKDALPKNVTEKLRSLTVRESDVAKVTEARITDVWLHPSPSKLLCAAGDKNGYLGLWDVEASSDGNGGVFKYRPHISNICRLLSRNSEPSKLYSVSYDGTARFIDMQHDAFSLAFEAPEAFNEVAFSDACFTSDGSSMLIGRFDGKISCVDLRETHLRHGSSYSWTSEIHSSRINSIQVHPTNSNIVITATSSQSGYIAVHDLRKSSRAKWEPILTLKNHSKSINGAVVSPDGQFLVSVSQDDTIRTWTNFTINSNSVKCKTTRHDNHTGRWLSTFRPIFDPKQAHLFVLGSMDRPRRVEIFEPSVDVKTSDVALNLLVAIKGDYLNSVCSRNCFHPALNVLACGNSSGRVHIIR